MIDFAFLRQQGIDLMQQLTGETYTDYNLHDPGVTMLEALCYAITDLSYRTGFPIADLLADKDGNIPLQKNALFVREDILSSNPVTVNDFRKFILDSIDSLHNVWLEPFISGFSHGTMHGLYSVKIQVKKEFAQQVRQDGNEWVRQLQRQVRTCFTSARNLCEDLVRDLTVLRPVSIRISAGVVITGDQPESILADIYRDLETAINPPVKYYTAQELLDNGLRVEDIYAGPFLKKGFIPDTGLPPRRRTIDPTELMKVISQVPGVSYVRDLSIITPQGATDKAPYVLEEDACPYFEQGIYDSPIRLLKGKYEVRIRESVFNDIWPRVDEAARRSLEPVGDPHAAAGVRQGQYRDVKFYKSFQHLFPVVYGIGADGLGADPSPQRVAVARQLKAYLLFFEQVLANYLAQLANISGFFSFDASPSTPALTYYHQPLYEVPGIRWLLRAFTERAGPDDDAAWKAFTADNNNGYIQSLTEGEETSEVYRERKNAILDHLLARFNQQPSTYPVKLYVHLYGSQPGAQDEVLQWKAGLLGNMVSLGYNRVRGGDYLLKEDDKGGFYKLMAALLYIHPWPKGAGAASSSGDAHSTPPSRETYSTFPTGDIRPSFPSDDDQPPLLYGAQPSSLSGTVLKELTLTPGDADKAPGSPPTAEEQQHKQEWATVADADVMRQRVPETPGSPTSGPQMYAGASAHSADPSHRTDISHGAGWNFSGRKMSFFLHGLNAGNYTIGPDPGGSGGWLILFKEPEDNSWQIISRHPDEARAAASLKDLIARLRRISVLSEGFYVIEHVLLRPPVVADVFGFRFRTAKNEILLQHSRWTGFMERERILEDILHAVDIAPDTSITTPTSGVPSPGASVTGWAVKNLGERCRVQLSRHKELGFLTDPIDMEQWIWEEAAPDVEKVRQQLLLFRENKLRFYPRFEMLVKGKDENMIREEFFNFNMTIVLPAWPARFQDANFQAFVMDLFRIHTPAHIRLYFQSLNISHMREFERLYPHWITALKNQDDPEPRKRWSDEIIHFLKKGVY